MAERKISFKIEALGTDEVSKQIEGLEKDMISFAEERKKLRKEAKEGRISEDELAKGLANLKVKQQQVTKEQAKLRKSFIDGRKVANGLSGSYNDLVTQTNLLRQRLKNLPNAFDETNEEANELKKQIAENTEQLKKFDKEIGDNFRNVGNYSDSIKEAFANTGILGDKIQAVGNFYERATKIFHTTTGAVQEVENANKATAVSTTLLSKAMKILRLALISTGIGAIVVALGSVVSYLSSTTEGSDKLSKAMAVLGGAVDAVLKTFNDLGRFLVNVWSDPKKATDEFVESIGEFGDTIENSIERSVRIAEIEIRMRSLNRAIKLNNQDIEAQISLLEIASEDATTGFKDQEDALNKLLLAQRERARLNVEQAQKERELAQARLAQAIATGQGVEEARDAELEVVAKQKQAFIDLQITEANIAKTRRQLKQDQLEQDLDFLIDGFDNQKTINERIIADETRTEEERRALLAETKRLSDISFNEQIKVLQTATKENIDANDLINTSDAKLLNEKAKALGLSEILTKRLLEIVRDRKTANLDLAEAEIDLEKSVTKTKEDEAKNREKIADDEYKKEVSDAEARTQLIQETAPNDLDLIIEALEAERDIKLKNDELTANQRLLIEQQYQNQIDGLRLEGLSSEEELAKKRNEILSSSLETLTESFVGFAADQELTLKNLGKTVILSALDTAQRLINIKLAEITAQSLAQADSVATFGASGLARAAILTGLVNAPFSAVKAKVSKFEQGGMVNGPSHANGGVKFAVGGQVNELEGGEAVINKRSTSMFKPILSALNVAGGGRKFAEGGLINDSRLSSLGNLGSNPLSSITSINSTISDDIVNRIGEAVKGNLKVTNVVTDTADQINKVNNIQNEASI